jgi:hypothetical protein
MASDAAPATDWSICPAALADDDRFVETIRRLHEAVNRDFFADDPMANQRLGVQVRAFRRLEQWRLLLVLTPWMFSRLLLPERDPGIRVPPKWRAEARRDAPYQLLGPRVRLAILGQSQPAHLNYHPLLGHYLLQPIALNMEPYTSPEAVFEEWNQVIRTRDENMEKHRRDCPWQKEVSRRELFGRLRGRG